MRCPDPGCGWTTDGTCKFCQECGTKMVPKSTGLVVICDGRLDDGLPCHTELTVNQKFCKNCGKKVDQQLFTCLTETCTRCGTALEQGCVFCTECGMKNKGNQSLDSSVSNKGDSAFPQKNAEVQVDRSVNDTIPVVGASGDSGQTTTVGISEPASLYSIDVDMTNKQEAAATSKGSNIPILEQEKEQERKVAKSNSEADFSRANKDNKEGYADQTTNYSVQNTNITTEMLKNMVIDDEVNQDMSLCSVISSVTEDDFYIIDEERKLEYGDIEPDTRKVVEELELKDDETVDSDMDSDGTELFQRMDLKEDQVEEEKDGTSERKKLSEKKKNKKQRKKEKELLEKQRSVQMESNDGANQTDDKSTALTEIQVTDKNEPSDQNRKVAAKCSRVETNSEENFHLHPDNQTTTEQNEISNKETVNAATANEEASISSKGALKNVTQITTVEEDRSVNDIGPSVGATGDAEPTSVSTTAANSEPTSVSTTASNSEPTSVSTTAANSELTSVSTTAGNSEPTSVSTTAGNSEPTSVSTTAANFEPTSVSTTAANSEPTSVSTNAGNFEPTSVSTTAANSEPTSVSTNAGNSESTSVSATAGNSEPTSVSTNAGNSESTSVSATSGNSQPTSVSATAGNSEPISVSTTASISEPISVLTASVDMTCDALKDGENETDYKSTALTPTKENEIQATDENKPSDQTSEIAEIRTLAETNPENFLLQPDNQVTTQTEPAENGNLNEETVNTTTANKDASISSKQNCALPHSSETQNVAVEMSNDTEVSVGALGAMDQSSKIFAKSTQAETNHENYPQQPDYQVSTQTEQDGNGNLNQATVTTTTANERNSEYVFGNYNQGTQNNLSDVNTCQIHYPPSDSSLFTTELGKKENSSMDKSTQEANIANKANSEKSTGSEIENNSEPVNNLNAADEAGHIADTEAEINSAESDDEPEKADSSNKKRKRKSRRTPGQGQEKPLKKDEKNKKNETSQSKPTTTNENKQSEQSTYTDARSKVCVHFHILVSPDFNIGKHDQVVLRIGIDTLGGWNSNKNVLHHVREIDGYMEMQIDMLIEPYLLTSNNFQYKYGIIKSGAFVWENYHDKNKKGFHDNRKLSVPSDVRNREIWHQFDGVVIPKPKDNIFKRGIDWVRGRYEKNCEKYAQKFAAVFCPDWFKADIGDIQSVGTIQESIDLLECLIKGLRSVYLTDAGCWEKEEDFKIKIGGGILSPMIEHICKLQPDNSEHNLKIIRALSVVIACKNTRMTLPEKDLENLCTCLLVHPDSEKQTCAELDLILQYYPQKDSRVLGALVYLVDKVCMCEKNPSWLFCMPLIHFLSGKCQPFELLKKDITHAEKNPVWWGTHEVNTAVNNFKKGLKWKIPLEEVLNALHPLFEMDFYLPRTIMAALNLHELKVVIEKSVIPAEVCCATLLYHVRSTKSSWYITSDSKVLGECLSALCTQLHLFFVPTEVNKTMLNSWWMAYKIAAELVQEYFNTNKLGIISASHVLLYNASIYEKINQQLNSSVTEGDHAQLETEHLEYISAILNEVLKWMKSACCYWYLYFEDSLTNWNSVFAEELQSENIKDLWNKQITAALSRTLENDVCKYSGMMQKFVQLYCEKIGTYTHPMQECLNRVAFSKEMENGYNNINFSTLADSGRKKFGELLSKMYQREWDKVTKQGTSIDNEAILRMALTWSPFEHFMHNFCSSKGTYERDILEHNCLKNLGIAVSIIDNYSQILQHGTVCIGMLRRIQENAEKFSNLVQLANEQLPEMKALIQEVILFRTREVEVFQFQAKQMTTLSTMCAHLQTVDTKDVELVLCKQEKLEEHSVAEFCRPLKVTQLGISQNIQPDITAFQVSPDVFNMLPELQDCQASNVFMKLWTKHCAKYGAQCSTLDDVFQKVWIPVKQRWDQVSHNISKGLILFQDMEDQIGHVYRNDYEAMMAELKSLHVKEAEAKERISQLKQYRQLETCMKGARVILKFANEYNLEGDFEQIRVIAAHHEDFQMRRFDQSLMKTCEFLKNLTDDRAECLDAFVQCGPLVKWLKESMKKSGLKELKVFVDLAFMSAGEEPINIARVQCLHSAVTGYAPLIFDLKPKSGYRELLHKCEIVWKELEANKGLPQKLIDTNRQLEWLKEIEKAHGSVEVTSLVQAEAINSHGIFTVGRSAKQDNDGELVQSNILRLTVPDGQEGKRQLRNYTFAQLQDLQSRLMLVAGKAEKGNVDVERFTMIFDSVIRLSIVYIKLCSAGCVLFTDWTAKFLCDNRRPVCAILEFGQGENAPSMKGRKTKTEQLQDIIPQLAKFMETCLEEWLDYIRDKREKYLQLNYFTVDQLVILQRELVKVGTVVEPSHKIYPLLSAIKHNCTPDDLLEAMREAMAELEPDVDMEEPAADVDDMGAAEGGMDEQETEDVKRRVFIQELVTAGYDENLAVRALEHVSPDEVTEGILWCLRHCDDNEEEEMEVDDADSDRINTAEAKPGDERRRQAFSGWSRSERSIQSVITSNISGLTEAQSEVGVEPLIRNLKTLWREFLGSITSNIQDYLSLEHLGLILGYLAQKDRSHVNRSLPPGFEEGKPNLIVCPSSDVLSTVLSMYMLERGQPLPMSDEVLMCTTHTTIDEVDIFWRRAIFDGGRKIHCLVNADMLDFDVSEAAESCLEQYIQKTNYDDPKYRLVVVCGSDNEYRSRIVSSLDKHRRPALPVNANHLRGYLATKLRIDKQFEGVKSAATVDFDRSSVRLVKSWRSGVGKTLYKKLKEVDLARLNHGRIKADNVSIPLQEKHIDMHSVIERLLEHTEHPGQVIPRIFHLDVAHEVQYGVDYLLFNLLVLGCLMDKTGYVWRKSPTDLYLVETMPLMIQTSNQRDGQLQYVHQMLSILPDLTCRSPQESLDIYRGKGPQGEHDQLFDKGQFEDPIFQRPFQYLFRLDRDLSLEDVDVEEVEGSPLLCLQTLLGHCGMQDPSWAELHHFVWFLNTQLCGFEQNSFVSVAASRDLPGFSKFVLKFLIQMSRDFSTRSLNICEESPGVNYMPVERMEAVEGMEGVEQEEEMLERYQMRRTWESSPHPYLFFNSDKFTFTFLGFNIDRATGNLIDQQTGEVLENGIMAQKLYDSLVRNHAPIQEDFDSLPRDQKILKLCSVMGVDMPHDPDDTYELTTDNVKKILAIYMRFRCDIPVIIMGETGCGKTRLIKFMCALQTPPGVDVKNMILMKVHGGTTNEDIKRKVRVAEEVAQENIQTYGQNMFTVLFFDEANTTESIGLIKEIMCDKSMEGNKLKLCENLKMVAACNPYRKHSDELIKKLEQAGLGYHVDADETTDKLGRVPMRRLVYRVQPLPQSLLPLVWDFGQLNTQVEDLYIRQMVRRYIRDDDLPNVPGFIEVVSAILTASQDYMREQKDECSFVSLRDVDRVLSVMSWFYSQSQGARTLYDQMDEKLYHDEDSSESEQEEEEEEFDEMEQEDISKGKDGHLDEITRSLVLALGVCYHACLKTRPQYREHIAKFFRRPCLLPGGEDQIEKEIVCCQDVFLDNIQLEKNIARNMALKENLFMMVVCIELRIPLFLVGKPGSSKSLAKTIVSDAMQGNSARKPLFKELKQAQMVSFQCSPLSTPDGIMGTFRQCAQFQQDKDLNSFVSIVVLDEVGLAEDSPRMPLKTLHPLLEDGCQGDETPEKYKKVAFIGISNWALDPAKMNRGILVQREVPDLEELQNSARGICSSSNDQLQAFIEPLIKPMALSYLKVFENASENMREFFGLRDFYSLVKMVYSFVEESRKQPSWHQMLHAIKRNFGGLDQVDPVDTFRKKLSTIIHLDDKPSPGDPDCTAAGLIHACLFDNNNTQSESRYLLLLTENYGALTILQQQILARRIRPITIFGSSFRSDQEYTQVCRNINKIKVCMETGNTVVLLNLENLYESLYDALNQYYVYFGGERYVDLGLGTHRVKCPVHKDFRLIVVAEKQTVYKKFPIPLINRLEKHFLTINTMLSPEQLEVVAQLEDWAKQFAELKINPPGAYRRDRTPSNKVGDVFMGYHDDTCSAIVLHVWSKNGIEHVNPEQVLQEAKATLLWCATPDSVARLVESSLPCQDQETLNDIYYGEQKHESIVQYLQYKLVEEQCEQLFAQVTTHSKLFASFHKTEISKATGIAPANVMLLDTLSSFDTEQQFSNKIQQHLQKTDKDPRLLVIQCDSGDINANLVACARYCVMDEYQKVCDEIQAPVHVVFIVQLPRIAGGCFTGFQCGVWHSVHIDDLWTNDVDMPSVAEMQDKSIAQLVGDAVRQNVSMETDDSMTAINFNNNSDGGNMEFEESEYMTSIEQATDASGHQNLASAGEGPRPSTSSDILYSREQGPLQLEDVIVGFDAVGGGRKREKHGNKLNMKSLLLACVQAALSMVKDKDENTARTTDRVLLVLELVHSKTENDDQPFLEGVSRLVACLLEEKEGNAQSYGAKQWLVKEAARFDSIHKAGTFRRSCLQTFESKISPILAGIIAYLDTNQNLSILQKDKLPWKLDLWFSVLNTPGALHLKYSDLQSPKRLSDLQEANVMTTGCEGHVFQCRLPFSWLLHDQIAEILKTPATNIEEEEVPSQKVVLLARVLSDTPLGKLLMNIQDSAIVQELVQEYIHDFVHVMYHSHSEVEHTLVIQSVNYVTSQMSGDLQEGSLLHTLLSVHMSYQSLAPRLAYFRTMNHVWPECSSRIVELKQAKPDHFMFKEEEFTFSALCLLIENLTPVQNELDNPAGRTAWLNKVHQYRPVIEKIMGLHADDPERYGAHGFKSVQRARGLWSRVVSVKLFLEHVCITGNSKDNRITIKRCMPLWQLLTEEANLKEMKSLAAVESFLKLCNRAAIKDYLGKEERCCNCEAVLEGPQIALPCKDIVCDQCYQDLRAIGENKCPKCKKNVSQNWKPDLQNEKKNETKKLRGYQKCCNTFFMDVVSQLCFADNSPPSDEVINKLLGYITCTTRKGKGRQVTKELTIFDSGIDPNPVFRLFLLQLLMKTSEDKVKDYLARYLSQAEGLLQGGSNEKQYVELCQLVIQCLEDILLQEKNKTDVDEAVYALKCLQQASYVIYEAHQDNETVEKLYGLAKARVGLAVAAKYIRQALVQQAGRAGMVEKKVRKLIEAAQNLCLDGELEWPRVYLVKYMCRCYGIDTYQAVCRSQVPYLRWISMPDMNRDEVVEGSDRYVICGDIYTRIRESVTKVILGEDIQQLNGTLQGMRTAASHVEEMFQLAIHREITCSNLYPEQQRKVTPEILDKLTSFMNDSDHVKNKDLLRALLRNQLGDPCTHLTITEGEDLRHQGLQCLLLHFKCVVSQLQGDRTLMQPLIALVTNPQAFANAYLPTMPQDDLEDVREALLAARGRAGGNENPVFYRCPNGHPYVIGDCGRPAYVGRCKDCGADIGGQGYHLRPGNVLDQGRDQTLTGHILGQAEVRGRGPVSQRTLTPAYCACVRLISHMAMYLGAANNIQGMHMLIKPGIRQEEVPEFLWQHIVLDIDDLQRALGRSVDDVLLLGHSIINKIMSAHKQTDLVREQDVCQLSTKNGRMTWEQLFSTKFIQPILQNMQQTLKTNNQLLVQDRRLGADPLLCLLYEIDSQEGREDPAMIQNVPAVWRYRTPISIDHLRHEFEAQATGQQKGRKQHKVLQLFLQEEHYLRAIRYIPSILRLHRALFRKYQRKLDKAEASTTTVGQLKREEILGADTHTVIQDFVEAWDLVRETLKLYLCPTDVGGMTVPKEYCNRHIEDKTSISVLLPTTKEAGLCSFALLDFLMRKQNDFLNQYLKQSARDSTSVSTIPAREVTSAHLISYDPQHDILPLVLANCQYSFEIGKGTKIEYDFTSLERQLMDRFLFSKSRIDVGKVLQTDLMIYRAEFTNAAVFKKLSDKIPQVALDTGVKSQICTEIRNLPDLCQSLDNLDITISFLKSIGGDPRQRLNDFMVQTLQMEASLLSQKARQVCEFQHTQSLWMVLSLQKSKVMTAHHQPRESIFESVIESFHDDLPEEVEGVFKAYMRNLSIDKLSQLVEVLHEYILLKVAVRENTDDEDYTDLRDNQLGIWLKGYVEGLDRTVQDLLPILTDFPTDILHKHSVHAWITMYGMLQEKLTGNRRF